MTPNTINQGLSESTNAPRPGYSQPDPNKKKENRDDSLENANPSDSRADEKVIVNEQVSNKTVNAPSQTAVNTSEGISLDEETLD